jgi:hypothetical protein
MDKKSVFLTITVTLISAIGLFASGYYIKSLLSTETDTKKIDGKPIIPVEVNVPDYYENDSTLFLPGKHYFDDTIILISKAEPHYTVVATANRSEGGDVGYVQGTRVSFYNGNDWKRVTRSDTNLDSSIKNNEYINNWTIDYDKSKVLKQKINGQLNIKNEIIGFETQVLENEIGVRSLPGYTKFMSEGDGTLTIGGKTYESYVLYTRIYSSNSSDLFTYDGNMGLLTHWVAFWDNSGNFYHIDSTEVKNPVPNYQTHSIGISKDTIGNILKTFSVSVNKDNGNPPQNYEVTLGYPNSKTIKFNKYNDINKAPNNSYSWHMGNVKGENGIGLVEYIFK